MVLEKVKAILAEQFDVEEDKITADTLVFSHLIFERSFLRPLFVLLKKVENLQI